MKKIIINKENDIFQILIALKNNRVKRNMMKMFFVEGVIGRFMLSFIVIMINYPNGQKVY